MIEDKEFQKKIKKAEKTGYFALLLTSIVAILLIFAIYNPASFILKNNVIPYIIKG